MKKIKKIGVLSLGKMLATMYAAFGLIAGILIAIGSSFAYGRMAMEGGLSAFMVGPLAIIGLPIMYGIAGFLGGIIAAALYNLFAKWIGGISIELE